MAYNSTDSRFRDKLEGMGNGSGVSALDQSPGSLGGFVNNHGGKIMQIAQTILGGFAVLGAIQLAVINNLPSPPGDPIVVHSVALDGGRVVQDRTVSTDATFTAKWRSEIVNDRTGEHVPWCSGSGVWDYQPGRVAPVMSLSEWVGNPECTLDSLPPGQYQPQVSFKAGEWSSGVIRGELFTVEGVGE